MITVFSIGGGQALVNSRVYMNDQQHSVLSENLHVLLYKPGAGVLGNGWAVKFESVC